MKFSICLSFVYFLFVKEHYVIIAINSRLNISSMNTSSRTTINKFTTYRTSSIFFFFSFFVSCILCLYVIFHNEQNRTVTSMIRQTINERPFYSKSVPFFESHKREYDISTTNNDNGSDSSRLIEQKTPNSWETNRSIGSF